MIYIQFHSVSWVIQFFGGRGRCSSPPPFENVIVDGRTGCRSGSKLSPGVDVDPDPLDNICGSETLLNTMFTFQIRKRRWSGGGPERRRSAPAPGRAMTKRMTMTNNCSVTINGQLRNVERKKIFANEFRNCLKADNSEAWCTRAVASVWVNLCGADKTVVVYVIKRPMCVLLRWNSKTMR